jgi:hypothetical protein
VLIQLTVSNTRTVEQKKALYGRIVERLGKKGKKYARQLKDQLLGR